MKNIHFRYSVAIIVFAYIAYRAGIWAATGWGLAETTIVNTSDMQSITFELEAGLLSSAPLTLAPNSSVSIRTEIIGETSFKISGKSVQNRRFLCETGYTDGVSTLTTFWVNDDATVKYQSDVFGRYSDDIYQGSCVSPDNTSG
ncbi:MAG: hypothetical protein JJ850_09055 [Kordiimonadaceae bacterium]|nr:hypothetical protein [Kordiimonadaceae bacterium]MBO6569277.1 hypothetical protein [Kordiimonadaceae bacterium]MBO6964753.1 hypothetical protein [Kordiimonadaceae bacterium]